MSESPAELPRLDLPRSRASRMYVFGVRPLDAVLEMALAALLGQEPMFTSGRTYSRSRTKHLLMVVAGPRERNTSRLFTFGIHYDARNDVNELDVPRLDNKEPEFLEFALSYQEPWTFQCNIEFEFSDVDENTLWFPLPSRIGGTLDSPESFLLTGVRAVRLGDDEAAKPEYNFTLDRRSDGRVFLDLYFPANEIFSRELPSILLERGVTIARQLVVEGP